MKSGQHFVIFPNTKRVENMTPAEYFFDKIQGVWNVTKHCFLDGA